DRHERCRLLCRFLMSMIRACPLKWSCIYLTVWGTLFVHLVVDGRLFGGRIRQAGYWLSLWFIALIWIVRLGVLGFLGRSCRSLMRLCALFYGQKFPRSFTRLRSVTCSG